MPPSVTTVPASSSADTRFVGAGATPWTTRAASRTVTSPAVKNGTSTTASRAIATAGTRRHDPPGPASSLTAPVGADGDPSPDERSRPRSTGGPGPRERRRWDLNPRKGYPFTTLAGSRTRPGYATSPSPPRLPARRRSSKSPLRRHDTAPHHLSYAHVASVSMRPTASPIEIAMTTSAAWTPNASACVVSPLLRWNTDRYAVAPGTMMTTAGT